MGIIKDLTSTHSSCCPIYVWNSTRLNVCTVHDRSIPFVTITMYRCYALTFATKNMFDGNTLHSMI